MTMMPPEHWRDFQTYGVYDDDGTIIGIKDDAPPEVKKAFDELKAEYEAGMEKNIIL